MYVDNSYKWVQYGTLRSIYNVCIVCSVHMSILTAHVRDGMVSIVCSVYTLCNVSMDMLIVQVYLDKMCDYVCNVFYVYRVCSAYNACRVYMGMMSVQV